MKRRRREEEEEEEKRKKESQAKKVWNSDFWYGNYFEYGFPLWNLKVCMNFHAIG